MLQIATQQFRMEKCSVNPNVLKFLKIFAKIFLDSNHCFDIENHFISLNGGATIIHLYAECDNRGLEWRM